MNTPNIAEIKDVYSGVNSWKSLWDHATGAGESPGWAMAGIATDFVGLAQSGAGQIAGALGKASVAEAVATPIIEAGLLALMGMSNTLGVGEPESGERFGHAAEAFNTVGATLTSTHAPDSWEGEASGSYTARNSEHQWRAQDLADQDALIKQALDEQRINVKDTRTFIDHRAIVLTAAIPIALAAEAANVVPGFGLALSMAIQCSAVALTVPPSAERYGEMIHHAARHATTIRRAGAGYDRIAQQAGNAAAQ